MSGYVKIYILYPWYCQEGWEASESLSKSVKKIFELPDFSLNLDHLQLVCVDCLGLEYDSMETQK